MLLLRVVLFSKTTDIRVLRPLSATHQIPIEESWQFRVLIRAPVLKVLSTIAVC